MVKNKEMKLNIISQHFQNTNRLIKAFSYLQDLSTNIFLIQKLFNKQFSQSILIDLIDLLFICLSFVLLRSFAVSCNRSRSFCDIFALLCDFLRSSAIFYALLRLVRSSANLCYRSNFLLRSSANFFNLLRSSADFLRFLLFAVVRNLLASRS